VTLPELRLLLPVWVERALPPAGQSIGDVAARMRFVVELARQNVLRSTGGPFAAAVFDIDSGRLVAPGVNVVVPARWSAAHAEIVACALAQQVRGSHDLGAAGLPACELVTSVEPCAMCLGAVTWSGVCRVVCGAREGDARAVGFDEGPKPAAWVEELERRGIEVVRDIERAAAREVLETYARGGGPIYNGRGGSPRGTSS